MFVSSTEKISSRSERVEYLEVPIIFQKRMIDAAPFVAGEGVKMHGVDAVKNVLFDLGIFRFQASQQLLGFPSFGAFFSPLAFLRKPAGTLDEREAVIPLPREDIVLTDAVERTDQLHPLKVLAVQLREHRLQLRAVEHCHYRRFDHVVEMMPERDLVAAELLGFVIEMSSSHLGAKITRLLLRSVRHL